LTLQPVKYDRNEHDTRCRNEFADGDQVEHDGDVDACVDIRQRRIMRAGKRPIGLRHPTSELGLPEQVARVFISAKEHTP